MRSKAVWGYSSEFLAACRAELTYTAAQCGGERMWVGVAQGTVVGFSHLQGEPPRGELAALFVDPATIGCGYGKELLLHSLRVASAAGFTHLTLDADPGAESFYLRFGATRIGTSASGSIPGRELPRLEFTLPPRHRAPLR